MEDRHVQRRDAENLEELSDDRQAEARCSAAARGNARAGSELAAIDILWECAASKRMEERRHEGCPMAETHCLAAKGHDSGAMASFPRQVGNAGRGGAGDPGGRA